MQLSELRVCGIYLQGKFKEAEPLQRKALEIDINYYGEEHPEVAADLGNLASLMTGMVGSVDGSCLPMKNTNPCSLRAKERKRNGWA